MKNNHWYSVPNQSLALYARHAGFDLALYESYDTDVQLALRKRTVIEALWAIKTKCWEYYGVDLDTINSGLYVISLSNPLSIRYRTRRSQVIYIGRGQISGRIKSHFELKLFNFMLGLSGANFDFHFARPARPGTKNYFIHVEHLMLEYFSEEYGGMDEKRRFPLLNKNAGTDREYAPGDTWWKKPLKASGKRPMWELKPTDYSALAPLDGL